VSGSHNLNSSRPQRPVVSRRPHLNTPHLISSGYSASLSAPTHRNMAPSATCLMSLAVLTVTCCCSSTYAATSASKLNSARQRAEVIIAAQRVRQLCAHGFSSTGHVQSTRNACTCWLTLANVTESSRQTTRPRSRSHHYVTKQVWGVGALQNTLLRSVTAPPSPPAPPQTAASNQRMGSFSAARLQSGPYCGDGNCDVGEDCKTCAQDCFQVCLSGTVVGRQQPLHHTRMPIASSHVMLRDVISLRTQSTQMA
jgi:hypothetical protein